MISSGMASEIYNTALNILEKTGIFVENHEAIQLLMGAGVEIKDDRALIGGALVDQCVNSAPSEIKLYDRVGNFAMDLAGNNVHFVPGSAAVYFRDSDGEIRQPETVDYMRLIRLTDLLPNIAAQSTAMIPCDVRPEVADLYRLYLSLLYSQKPIVTGTFAKENFEAMKEMLIAIRGSEDALREKPLAIFDCCPSPPLKWSDLTCQALIDCARSGIPAELISMPQPGATAPITLHGSLVQHTAESLSGVVIHQLAHEGAPIIYGGSPNIIDMKTTAGCLGAIETLMIHSAYAQIGRYLELPTHGYMGLSDTKDLDMQTGDEASAGTILAALSGVNVVAGAGMLGSENCQSLEKLLYDNEICGRALRLTRGIDFREAGETEQIMDECILGDDSFLEHSTTFDLFREELLMPSLFMDRAHIGTWLAQSDKQDLNTRLKHEVQKLLLENHPNRLTDSDAERELCKIWQRCRD